MVADGHSLEHCQDEARVPSAQEAFDRVMREAMEELGIERDDEPENVAPITGDGAMLFEAPCNHIAVPSSSLPGAPKLPTALFFLRSWSRLQGFVPDSAHRGFPPDAGGFYDLT
jgi:hypothetical protein